MHVQAIHQFHAVVFDGLGADVQNLANFFGVPAFGDELENFALPEGQGKYSDRTLFAYPTFITTDLKMPGADGFAVLEHLKEHPAWAIIPTVVLSASRDLDDIKKSYMLGASSYLVKPASPDALRQMLKVLHDYWMTCEVPEVDSTGKQLLTESKGKLGERFAQP